MEAAYLRIKNWGKLQHYSDRRPPWIKLYQGLLGDDDDFARLDEATQWQLVRIWIVASRSSALTVDELGHQVPVVANDAASLQRSIQSLKRVPLAKLIREGWLIPVSDDELVEAAPRKRKAIGDRSKIVAVEGVNSDVDLVADAESDGVGASAALAPRKHDASALYRGRGTEGLDLASIRGRQSGTDDLPESINPENLLLVTRLMHRIGDHADDGTHHVVTSYAAQLPPAALAKVIESIEITHPQNRAAYAVSALRCEIEERSNAA